MPTVGFETTTPEGKRPQTYALDHSATEIGNNIIIVEELKTNLMSLVVFISLIFAQHVSNINPYRTNVENRVSS